MVVVPNQLKTLMSLKVYNHGSKTQLNKDFKFFKKHSKSANLGYIFLAPFLPPPHAYIYQLPIEIELEPNWIPCLDPNTIFRVWIGKMITSERSERSSY